MYNNLLVPDSDARVVAYADSILCAITGDGGDVASEASYKGAFRQAIES